MCVTICMVQNENVPSVIPNILATSCITCNAKYLNCFSCRSCKMWKINNFTVVIYSMCLYHS